MGKFQTLDRTALRLENALTLAISPLFRSHGLSAGFSRMPTYNDFLKNKDAPDMNN
jgi:hypothetical protein